MRLHGVRSPPDLRDADDGPAGLQLLPGDSVVVEALQVDGGFAGFGHVVEPDFAAQAFAGLISHG